ncbi:MAG: hypothetical protein IPG86_21015 [Chitinophagaceae bacterium]|nr:hypothetical protein [Chitinophagaceae bacterium]
MKKIFTFLLLLSSFASLAEGGKNLTPANTGPPMVLTSLLVTCKMVMPITPLHSWLRQPNRILMPITG